MPDISAEVDEVEIRIRRPDGALERVSWADLRAVLVETSPPGPKGTAWTWILVGTGERCAIPGDAMGSDSLLERFQNLPGFQNDAFIEAMNSADTRRFVCWRRVE